MSRPEPLRKMTFEEFLAWEDERELRHEYVAGEVYAMAGGSKNHNLIVGNAYIALRALHDPLGCRTYSENVLLRLDLIGKHLGYYPDLMLVCEPDDAPREVQIVNHCIPGNPTRLSLADIYRGLDFAA